MIWSRRQALIALRNNAASIRVACRHPAVILPVSSFGSGKPVDTFFNTRAYMDAPKFLREYVPCLRIQPPICARGKEAKERERERETERKKERKEEEEEEEKKEKKKKNTALAVECVIQPRTARLPVFDILCPARSLLHVRMV